LDRPQGGGADAAASKPSSLTALVAGLAFVAEASGRLAPAVAAAATLVSRLTLVPTKPRRRRAEGRARRAQNEQAGEDERNCFAPHL